MTDLTQVPTPLPRGRPGDRIGAGIAWCVILACVGLVFGSNLYSSRVTTPSVPSVPSVSSGAGRGPGQSAKHPTVEGRPAPSVELMIAGRTAIGTIALTEAMRHAQPSGAAAPAADASAAVHAQQVRDLAVSPLDKVRAAPVLAELRGREAALAELDEVRVPAAEAGAAPTALDGDLRSLRLIYTSGPDALDEQARQELIRRHGWFGQLAVSWGKPESDPARKAALGPAYWAAGATIAMGAAVLLGFFVGLTLAIVALIFYVQGRIRSAYATYPASVEPTPHIDPSRSPYRFHPLTAPPPPGTYYGYAAAAPPGFGPFPPFTYLAPPPPPPALQQLPPPTQLAYADPAADTGGAAADPVHPRGGPFVEAFAIYLGGQILLSLLLHLFVRKPGLAWEWMVLVPVAVAILWPRWRGIGKAEWKRALGWHAGRGVWREIGSGFVGYLAGLPISAAGLLVMILLTKLAHAHPSHPIQNDIGQGLRATLEVYLLACVWAPAVEETMFRGALFHHLRRFGKGWRWLTSAALVAVLFAAIHPQGWTFIPALGALAVVLAGIREWRGSIIAPATAHFIQNFTVVTLLLVMVG